MKSRHDATRSLPPLSDFARHNVTRMRFFCGGLTCRHQSEVPIVALIEKLGPEATVEDVKRRGFCSKCGSKDISVQPSWPNPMMGSAREATK